MVSVKTTEYASVNREVLHTLDADVTCCMGAYSRGKIGTETAIGSDRNLTVGPQRTAEVWTEESTVTSVQGDLTSTAGNKIPDHTDDQVGWAVAVPVSLVALAVVVVIVLVLWKTEHRFARQWAGRARFHAYDRPSPAATSPSGDAGIDSVPGVTRSVSAALSPPETLSLLNRPPGHMEDEKGTAVTGAVSQTTEGAASATSPQKAMHGHPRPPYHPPPPPSSPGPSSDSAQEEARAQVQGPELHYAELEIARGAHKAPAQLLRAEKTEYAIILGELRSLVSTPLSIHPN